LLNPLVLFRNRVGVPLRALGLLVSPRLLLSLLLLLLLFGALLSFLAFELAAEAAGYKIRRRVSGS